MLDQIRGFIRSRGYDFAPEVLNSRWQKTKDSNGHKVWYIGTDHGNGLTTFTFGDFREPDKKFTYTTKAVLDAADAAKLEKFTKKIEKDKSLTQEITKNVVTGLYNDWEKISLQDNADYLIKKQIPRPPGVVVRPSTEDNQKILVIPMRDTDGEIWNIQQIYSGGNKTFHPGARVKGCFYTFGNTPTERILIGEGFATCAAAHLATGLTVVCAFNISNLEPAIRSLLDLGVKAGDIVLLADWDGGTFKRTGKNPGMLAVQKLTHKYKVGWAGTVSPGVDFDENRDFADIWTMPHGADLIRGMIQDPSFSSLSGHVFSEKRIKSESPVSNPPTPTAQNVSTQTPEQHVPENKSGSGGSPAGTGTLGLQVKRLGGSWAPVVHNIKTRNTGFHEVIPQGKTGVRHVPVFTDLRSAFEEQHPIVTHCESEIVYSFNGQKWEMVPEMAMGAFAETQFDPKPTNHMVREFIGCVSRYNVRGDSFFDTAKKINFQNGWLDLETLEFRPHSPDIGFKTGLMYDFDEQAGAPEWDAFMGRVLGNDPALIQMVMEFLGYVLSGDECWTAKALVLKGEGSNGKSTFLKIVRSLVGKSNILAAKIGDFKSEYYRQQLDGKLACISEETPRDALLESSYFKDIVSGGTIGARAPYGIPYNLDVHAKLIFSCNDMPPTGDLSPALTRRLLIVPFEAVFTDETADPFIDRKIIRELPGVFNKALVAYLNLVKRGRFEVAAASVEALREYQYSNNPLVQWLEEFCLVLEPGTPGADVFSSTAAMYRFFSEWSHEMGYQTRSVDWFRKQLSRAVGKNRFIRSRTTGKQRRGVIGVVKTDGTVFKNEF